jgi:hypothetical protein
MLARMLWGAAGPALPNRFGKFKALSTHNKNSTCAIESINPLSIQSSSSGGNGVEGDSTIRKELSTISRILAGFQSEFVISQSKRERADFSSTRFYWQSSRGSGKSESSISQHFFPPNGRASPILANLYGDEATLSSIKCSK